MPIFRFASHVGFYFTSYRQSYYYCNLIVILLVIKRYLSACCYVWLVTDDQLRYVSRELRKLGISYYWPLLNIKFVPRGFRLIRQIIVGIKTSEVIRRQDRFDGMKFY